MKKALQISIAQTLFTIEDDAYAKLEAYFQSIRDHFAKTEGKDEIISDIESRVSEQFLETRKAIITLTEVEAVIASMGKVEDFDDEANKATASPAPEKRFYRNPDDKVIAGVCSGIGVYTNIDPLWIRIAFTILTISTSGFGILIYLVLAMVVPEAKSSSQKLEMQGSPVTLETMSENITEKVQHIRKEHGSRIKDILAWPFVILKEVIQIFVTWGVPFMRVLTGLALAVGSLAVILCLSVLAPIILMSPDVHFDFPITHIVSLPLLYVSVIGLYLTIVLPLLVTFVAGVSLILERSLLNTRLIFSLLFLWCIAVVGFGVSSADGLQRIEIYTRTQPLYEQASREVPITSDIKALSVDNGIRVVYVQGETPSLTATGRTRIIDNFEVEERDGTVYMDVHEVNYFCLFCESDIIEVTLTLPELDALQAESGARVVAENWTSENPVTLDLSRGARGDITVTAPEVNTTLVTGSSLTLKTYTPVLSAEVDHGSHANIAGSSDSITLSADIGSWIDTEDLDSKIATATADHGSHIFLGEVESLEATAKLGSRIEYQGEPSVREQVDAGSSIEAAD